MGEDMWPVPVTLDGQDLNEFMDQIAGASSLRLVIQDGGVKVSVERHMWSLPLGRQED